MIFVSMVIDAQPGQAEKLAAAMSEMMEETRGEAGCLIYTYARDLAEPGRFHLSEIWQSLPFMEAHIDADHSIRFVAVLNEMARITSVKAFEGTVERMRIRAPASRPT